MAFFQKKKKYIYMCVPTLPKIFRPITHLFFLFDLRLESIKICQNVNFPEKAQPSFSAKNISAVEAHKSYVGLLGIY